MLVLTRKVGEELIIGDDICLRVSQIKGGRIRLAVDAPRNVSVKREEAAQKDAQPRIDAKSGGSSPRENDRVTASC